MKAILSIVALLAATAAHAEEAVTDLGGALSVEGRAADVRILLGKGQDPCGGGGGGVCDEPVEVIFEGEIHWGEEGNTVRH